jgi:hypothetical protein
MNPTPPNWLGVLMDPGIIERQMKAQGIRVAGLTAKMALVALLEAHRQHPESLADALEAAVKSIETQSEIIAKSYESIDAPVPPGKDETP